MYNSANKYIVLFLILLFAFLKMASCASIASPSGGSFDTIPPKVIKTFPEFNATNNQRKKIVIYFDENVLVEKPLEKVIITPPQKSFPIIQSINSKVTIELKDTLMENTTYTIDFTDAIVDNNEKNPLENFTFSFATGDKVDSLAVSGKILAADNLEPMKGVYVGLHSNLEDSAFITTKFLRISRTNDAGFFTIRGIAPGKYRIYALDDLNRDYKYDNPSEAIAFFDQIIEPTTTKAMRDDTIRATKDKISVDTIKTVQYTRFIPDNILLKLFKTDFKRKYLVKGERTEHAVSLIFSSPTQFPKLRPLNFDSIAQWNIVDKNITNDSISYWIKDKEILKMDTLRFEIEYLKTDSLNNDILFLDTLTIVDRAKASRERAEKKKEKEREKEARKKRDDESQQIDFLNVTHNMSTSWDVYKDIHIEFEHPIHRDSLHQKFKLVQVVDSTFTDLKYQLVSDSLNPRKFSVKYKWNYGQTYKFSIDSASIHSIYGLFNNKLEQTLQVRKEDEYGKLAFKIKRNNDSIPAFVELLDKSDKPIRKSIVKDNVAVFRDLNPDEYYARLIYDSNGNGVWDTGNFNLKLYPEEVFYNSKKHIIRVRIELTEDWEPEAIELERQKPLEITKNKPDEKKTKRMQQQAQKKQNQQQSSSGGQGMPSVGNLRNMGGAMR